MLQVTQRRFGKPEDVLRVEELASAPCPEGHLRVRIEAAPLLPMDQLRVRGLYPLLPELPAVAGSVGVGTVLEGPPGWTGRVVLPIRSGSWAEERVVPVEGAIPLPDGADPVQAAMLRVDGLTAQALLDGLERGSWVLVNAATGGVGRFVLALAARMGIHVVALSRRPEALPELRAAGAAVALVDEEDWPQRLDVDAPIHRALDGVGGTSTARLGQALAEGGRVVCYGAMSRRPPRLRVADSIFRGILLQGFWLYRLDQMRGIAETTRILRRMVELDIRGPVDSTWTLDQLPRALERYRSPERRGRVLFRPDTVWS